MILTKWIYRAALILGGISAFLFLLTLFAWIYHSNESEEVICGPLKPDSEKKLPSYFLSPKQDEYDAIGAPLFQTNWSPIALQLPDLRPILLYYGINSRPDAKAGLIRLQFGIGPVSASANSSASTLTSIGPKEPLYLVYERDRSSGRYLFSPNNQPTPLWIVADPQENGVKIELFLQDEQGKRVEEPLARMQFNLPQKELMRSGPSNWFLDGFRVDATLLARQKARWFGQDLFLNEHGGEEYQDAKGKERIEFSEGAEPYTVYVGPDDCLVWNEGRWMQASDVEDSTRYPLLCVKKIEERLLRFELWDVDGKARIPLTLLRSTEAWNPELLQKDFVFMAARTLSQYIFSIKKERTTLRAHDWFLLTKQEGWKKLATNAQIDAYVEEKDPGILFIFEGVKEKDDTRLLSGILYNSTRSAKAEVEFPFEHAVKSGSGKQKKDIKKTSLTNKSDQAGKSSKIAPKSTSPGAGKTQNNRTWPVDDEDDEDDDDEDEEDFEIDIEAFRRGGIPPQTSRETKR